MKKVLQVLRDALALEHQGHEYYRNAYEESLDPVVRSVLSALAQDEEAHESIITEYYRALEAGQGWPHADEEFTAIRPAEERIRDLFYGSGMDIHIPATFFQVYDHAYNLEVRSRDFYREQLADAADIQAQKFFRFLVQLEDIHIAMLDYFLKSAGSNAE
jgi:rubrerythrin